MRQQPAFLVPQQLFGGQPAHPLRKAAFNLAEADAFVDRAAGVVQNIDAQNASAFPVKPSTSTSATAAPQAK